MLGDNAYRYLTADEMKSLGDDSLPIDVTRDERMDSNKIMDSNMLPPQAIEDSISPHYYQQNYSEMKKYTPDNIDIARHPINIGYVPQNRFQFKLNLRIINYLCFILLTLPYHPK